MGEAQVVKHGLSRRSFLKTAGVAAGLAAAGSMTGCGDWLKGSTTPEAGAEEREMYLCHQFHCLSGCSLKAKVRDGRVVMVMPNDACDEKHRNICLRGITEVQHIYSADRLQTPLKRVGERGEGKFEAISWEEAIDEIYTALENSRQKYGNNSVFLRKSTEAGIDFDFITPLLHADSGSNWGLDRGSANGITPVLGAFTYCPTRSIWEFKDASTIIELGHNPLESGICWSRALVEAKEAGVYIVAIDPRFTGTASKANEWIPVLPGTDSALIQGMIRVIYDNKWYDFDFMKANTSLSFLVNTKTGAHLRSEEEMCPNPYPVDSSILGKPYIWDTLTQAPALYDVEGIEPAMEGTFDVDGETYTTEWELLQQWIRGITLDWASETCGIDADVIEKLADRYANNGPAIIDFGLGGPDKYTNADVLGHSMAMLAAMTGNFGRKGSGFGFYGGVGADEPGSALGGWDGLPADAAYGDSGIALYDFPYMDNNIHVALTYGDAVTLEAANAQVMLEWLKGLDFYAQIDIYHSSSVDYADIVLPACTKFECEEDVRHLRDSHGYVSLACGMVEPLFDSKSDLQIERMLLAKWGLDKYLPATYEELARKKLEGLHVAGSGMENVTVESLKKSQGVAMVPGTLNYFPDGYADQKYGTASTKIELYTEQLLSQGHQFPVYENANEAYESNPLKQTYPLYFTQGKTRYRIHAYYSGSQWFQEDYEPCVNINPIDAADRDISTGDLVRIYNDRGSFVCKAIVNEALRPSVLFMAETTYTTKYVEGFLQNVTNNARNERCYVMRHGPQIPYNDTLVQVVKA